MPRRCLILDLKDDAEAIAAYEQWHRPGNVPAPVLAAIRASGILEMEILRFGNRLVMLSETTDDFDPVAKAASDASNPDVVAWESLMRTFQQPVPGAPEGATWAKPETIFRLTDHPGA